MGAADSIKIIYLWQGTCLQNYTAFEITKCFPIGTVSAIYVIFSKQKGLYIMQLSQLKKSSERVLQSTRHIH